MTKKQPEENGEKKLHEMPSRNQTFKKKALAPISNYRLNKFRCFQTSFILCDLLFGLVSRLDCCNTPNISRFA